MARNVFGIFTQAVDILWHIIPIFTIDAVSACKDMIIHRQDYILLRYAYNIENVCSGKL